MSRKLSEDFIEPRSITEERERMVRDQIGRRGIKDERVLTALRTVPRHMFVPPDAAYLAYSDGPIPIGEQQTISQPYIVALMTDLLNLKGNEKILEVGTGSGYQAAVLGELCREVYTIERHPALANRAEEVLTLLGYDNVHVISGDGSNGYESQAPFDGIIVTAAAPYVSENLKNQLSDGSVLVIPVGGIRMQVLKKWIREKDVFREEEIIPVAFVPLRGEKGWKNDEWRR